MWVYTRRGLRNIAGSQGSATFTTFQGLGNSSLGLAKALLAPSVNTVMADVSECAYTGYARQALATWTTDPFIDTAGFTYIEAATKIFRPTTDANTDIAYAGLLLNSDSIGVYLEAVEVLDQPVPLQNTTNTLTYTPRFGLSPSIQFGNSIVAS